MAVTKTKQINATSAHKVSKISGYNFKDIGRLNADKKALGDIGYNITGMSDTSIRNAARDLALTKQIQDFNSAEAQKERDWSTDMSNTSHQREVADLKAAGLNPVLSANAGANSYSGASASSSTIDNTKTTLAAQKAMNSAQVSASKYATNKSYDANIKAINMNKELALINQDTSNYSADQALAAAATSAAATKYAADQNYAATVAGASISRDTQVTVANVQSELAKWLNAHPDDLKGTLSKYIQQGTPQYNYLKNWMKAKDGEVTVGDVLNWIKKRANTSGGRKGK